MSLIKEIGFSFVYAFHFCPRLAVSTSARISVVCWLPGVTERNTLCMYACICISKICINGWNAPSEDLNDLLLSDPKILLDLNPLSPTPSLPGSLLGAHVLLDPVVEPWWAPESRALQA